MSSPAVEEILGQLPIPQLAAQLGVDEPTVARAAAAAIPSLVGGLAHNADQGQEDAISAALDQHGSSGLLGSGQVDLAGVDTEDGAKIVQHIFGDQSTQLGHALGQRTGVDGSVVNRLLPILAPIVLAYLSSRLRGGQQQPGSGGVLGSILGGILSGGGLGSILGGAQAPAGPYPTDPGQLPTADSTPAQEGGSVVNPTPVGDAGSLSVDDTPSPGPEAQPEDHAPADQQANPQSGGSIVDEILGGLFGKR
ncbi:MAG TPA: DUF937 domain-containing protein [Propionibacteriaceae bacterium]|nr:DUF937 domain-containing protein [Propionibacteriaceae bacterium]